jgi:phosphoesterase RecJ-like protein
MYYSFSSFIKDKNHICVIQAENPDGDSLGSALALEEVLADKNVSLYCPVDIPKYMRYFDGWGRVTNEFDFQADAYIIVDTASSILLSKLLNQPPVKNALYTKPVFVIDHHETDPDLEFPYDGITESFSSNCALLSKIFQAQNMRINQQAAEHLIYGILSDTLGLTSQTTTADDYRTIANLLEIGELNIADLEERRREYSKKSQRIFLYKADLIKRTEFHLDGKLATVRIPFEDIQDYSDEYNPNVLILEELRLVQGVDIAVAIKTYPDGKVTGKIRSTKPIAETVASYFGGGGHEYAAGFRVYDDYETVIKDLIDAADKLL